MRLLCYDQGPLARGADRHRVDILDLHRERGRARGGKGGADVAFGGSGVESWPGSGHEDAQLRSFLAHPAGRGGRPA